MTTPRNWALVLGASSGFGEATALAFARAGRNVFGVHLDRRATQRRDVRGVNRTQGRAHGTSGEEGVKGLTSDI